MTTNDPVTLLLAGTTSEGADPTAEAPVKQHGVVG